MNKILKKIRLFFVELLKFPGNFYCCAIANFPGVSGMILRRHYWRRKLKFLGTNVNIGMGVYFQNPEYIMLGDNSWIDKNVIILAGEDGTERKKVIVSNKNLAQLCPIGGVYIGKNVHVAPNCIISGISAGVYISDDCAMAADCKIYAFTNHYALREHIEKGVLTHSGLNYSPERQCLIVGGVYIGENTGIALNAVILPGSSILKNSFVKINSVVMPGSKFSENSLISGDPALCIGKRFNFVSNN
jgi:acetyltransferase-like isoleucine patch superfamily enzyme